MSAAGQRYLVALGSNMRHPRHGAPAAILRAAVAEMAAAGLEVAAVAPQMASAPLGPSRRRYANTVAVVVSRELPPTVLARLQAIEQDFGRRRRGRRWGARVLDLDLVLWSGGRWRSPGLVVPHPHFRERRFVLAPAAALVSPWRDPITGLTIAHLATRLTRPKPTPTACHGRALSSVGRATDF